MTDKKSHNFRVEVMIYHYSTNSRKRLLRKDSVCVLYTSDDDIVGKIKSHIARITNAPTCLSAWARDDVKSLKVGKSVKIGWVYTPESPSDIVAHVLY